MQEPKTIEEMLRQRFLDLGGAEAGIGIGNLMPLNNRYGGADPSAVNRFLNNRLTRRLEPMYGYSDPVQGTDIDMMLNGGGGINYPMSGQQQEPPQMNNLLRYRNR